MPIATDKYSVDQINEEFAENNPTASHYMFESDEAWDKYQEYARPILKNLTDKFVAHLETVEAERQAEYRRNIKLYGNAPAGKDRYMWGATQAVYHNGSGIKIISCSGHGGALISIPQELKIDEELRCGRIYEEDCDLLIVFAYNPRIAIKFNVNYFTDDLRIARKICAERVVYNNFNAVKKIVGEA